MPDSSSDLPTAEGRRRLHVLSPEVRRGLEVSTGSVPAMGGRDHGQRLGPTCRCSWWGPWGGAGLDGGLEALVSQGQWWETPAEGWGAGGAGAPSSTPAGSRWWGDTYRCPEVGPGPLGPGEPTGVAALCQACGGLSEELPGPPETQKGAVPPQSLVGRGGSYADEAPGRGQSADWCGSCMNLLRP